MAWDGPTLVFVEVKSRATEEFGAPDRAVDREKEKRLLRAARSYAHRAGVEMERARFDIVTWCSTNRRASDLYGMLSAQAKRYNTFPPLSACPNCAKTR